MWYVVFGAFFLRATADSEGPGPSPGTRTGTRAGTGNQTENPSENQRVRIREWDSESENQKVRISVRIRKWEPHNENQQVRTRKREIRKWESERKNQRLRVREWESESDNRKWFPMVGNHFWRWETISRGGKSFSAPIGDDFLLFPPFATIQLTYMFTSINIFLNWFALSLSYTAAVSS